MARVRAHHPRDARPAVTLPIVPVARVVNCGVEFGGVQVGVIGLGNMGAHMATNLIKKGEDVVVFDGNC